VEMDLPHLFTAEGADHVLGYERECVGRAPGSSGSPCRSGALRRRFLPFAGNCARIADVHSAECTIKARTVSGHNAGYAAITDTTRAAAWAVAALVA
jgi:hypothetical protein